MPDQDSDRMSGADDGVRDDPVREGADPLTPAQAADDISGGRGVPDGRNGAGGEAAAAGGPAPTARHEVAAGRPELAGDTQAHRHAQYPGSPPLPPGPEHRPAGFAAGYPGPDGPGRATAQPEGEPDPGDAGSETWLPREPSRAGAQASPYALYGSHEPYPAHGRQRAYSGYGDPAGYPREEPPERPRRHGRAVPEHGDYGDDYRRILDYGTKPAYAGEPDAEDEALGGGDVPPGPDPGPSPGEAGRSPYALAYPPGSAYPHSPAYVGPDYPGEDYPEDSPYGGQSWYGEAFYGEDPAYGDEGWYEESRARGSETGFVSAQAYPSSLAEAEADEPPVSEPPAAWPGRAAGESLPPAHRPYPAGRGSHAAPAAWPGDPGPEDGEDGPATGDRLLLPGMSQPAPARPAPGREQAAGYPAAAPAQDTRRWPPAYETDVPDAPAPPGAGPRYEAAESYGRRERRRDTPEEPPPAYGGEAGYGLRPPAGAGALGAAARPGVEEALVPLPSGDQQLAETSDDLTAEALLPGKRQEAGAGWRHWLYRNSGGLLRPRESAEAARRRDLISRVRTPVAGGHHRVAVMSLKGGVGKTTTTVGLGAMLASLRGDRIVALDANPDRGTLSDKVLLETAATVRDLLNERDQIQRYADVRAFTSQAPSRLEVLASDRDPTVSVAFCEEDYYDTARVLEHYYSISLTDCGTGLLHSAMAGVLRMADQIILVSSPSVDGARSASATLDWLDAHDYGDLVRNAVVVLSMIRPRSKSTVDLDRLEHHFAGRCRAVVRVPYDAHLEEGAEVDLELMSPATVNAYLVLAATVADGFAWPRRAARLPA